MAPHLKKLKNQKNNNPPTFLAHFWALQSLQKSAENSSENALKLHLVLDAFENPHFSDIENISTENAPKTPPKMDPQIVQKSNQKSIFLKLMLQMPR